MTFERASVATGLYQLKCSGTNSFVYDPDDLARLFCHAGHQRDTNCEGCAEEAQDDLDYMLARFYSPRVGRFLGVDPIHSAKLELPQTWNKYLYGRDNPIVFWDRDGRESSVAIMQDIEHRQLLAGELTRAELLERRATGAVPVLAVASLFIPGPEDVVLGVVLSRAVVSRLGGGLARLFTFLRRGGQSLPKLRSLQIARSAKSKLSTVAEGLGKTSDEVLDAVQTGGKRVVDVRNGGRINVFAQIDGKLVRVTLDPEQKIIISAGREKMKDILKRIDSGDFIELDEIL